MNNFSSPESARGPQKYFVDALLGRTPSPSPAKRKAPAATEPDTQYLDSPGFLPPQQKRTKKDAVVDLTAED